MRRWCTIRRLMFSVFVLWLLGIMYYVVIVVLMNQTEPTHYERIESRPQKRIHVDVWGKAAIGEYFWRHVFDGSLQKDPHYLLERDVLLTGNVQLNYTTGPYLIPETAPRSVRNLVIILNGRTDKKVAVARKWLDTLLDRTQFGMLANLAIVLLGNERCENDWLHSYFAKHYNVLRFAFIVYDIREAAAGNHDDGASKIYQWPLGVATYRGFPQVPRILMNVQAPRRYCCNFLGTVYTNHSRTQLYNWLQNHTEALRCFMKVRHEWAPKEADGSAEQYKRVLRDSDLTLAPVGRNSEAYRIYEAMSYGSVPVIEDVMTEGSCGGDRLAPFRLLKRYRAPVIYIRSWERDLPALLRRQSEMPLAAVIRRRQRLLLWYERFKLKMKEGFVEAVEREFT